MRLPAQERINSESGLVLPHIRARQPTGWQIDDALHQKAVAGDVEGRDFGLAELNW